MAAILGDDGKGYELAMKLENHGVWRTWLGDAHYSKFLHSLSSQSSWHSFMSGVNSDIHLQLRVRALLFDKASLSLFLPSSSPSSSSSSSSSSFISNLNPSYLQLHADDVYFTLEDSAASNRDSKVQSQKFRQEDLPETWYHQYIEKYRSSRPYMVNRELDKRNPGEMSNYLKVSERYKRRKVGFKEDNNGGLGNSISENSHDSDCFFPETMSMMNCVPDSAVAPRSLSNENAKVEFNGVLDTLPKVVTKSSSSIMLERLGIRPEYLEQGPGPSHTKVGSDGSKRLLGEEQAMQMSKKVVARILTNVGFEGATEIPVEVFSQFLSCHISKLGRILKLLADSYKKQCSATELIKMFLQAGGNSLAALSEHVKDTRPALPQTPQQIQSPQYQLPLPQQNTLQLPQQIPRQMHLQMPQQMVRPHNLTPQQIEMLRRRQAASPRPLMNMDKDRPMVEVKLENAPELPMDSNALSAMNSRQAQIQWRQQQQIAAFQKFGHQLRQPVSMQIPQMHSPNVGAVRAQPVKVEGFQELMGGDSSLKQNSDESKLTSPSK